MYYTMKCFLIFFPFCKLFLHTFSYFHFYAFFQLHTMKFHQFIAFHLFSFFYSWIFTFSYSTGWQGFLLCKKILVFWWNSVRHRRLDWSWICCCYCFRCLPFCHCHGTVPVELRCHLKSQLGWLKLCSVCLCLFCTLRIFVIL